MVKIYRNQEADICQISMESFASVRSADMSWTKDMLSKNISLEPPMLAPSGESRYLTKLWVSRNEELPEELPLSVLSQSTDTGGVEMTASNIDPRNQNIQYKIKAALKLLTFRKKHVLVQFWCPRVVGKHQLLTTIDQPFGLGAIDERLLLCRRDSERNLYVADKDLEEENLSPPARVYRHGLLEWTFDLTHYLPKHFPQREYAIRCNLHGYLALPVFDSATGSCIGVLELLMSKNYISFSYEVQQAQKALKTQDLTCLQELDGRASDNMVNERMQNDFERIFIVMKIVCDIHQLPLAQTWAVSPLCSVVSREQSLDMSCNSFDTRCLGNVCMSTASLPFSIQDSRLWPFRKACKEQHLHKSCSIAGRALLSRGSCFCEDVSILSEDVYPLTHNARMSGLTSCFAIYLRSVESSDEYVLEFFLPFREDGRYIQNLVQTLQQNIDKASGFILGNESPIQVVGPPMDLSATMEPDIIQTSSYSMDTSTGTEDIASANSVNISDKCSSTTVSTNKKRKRGSDTGSSVNKEVQVKATYGEDITNFLFRISLGLLKLKRKVAKMFKLKGKTICLKYWDEDNDLILSSSDDDLQFALVASGGNRINLICELSD